MAILVLLYDLCLTPVAIAWDFPMQGWLLHLVWPSEPAVLKLDLEVLHRCRGRILVRRHAGDCAHGLLSTRRPRTHVFFPNSKVLWVTLSLYAGDRAFCPLKGRSKPGDNVSQGRLARNVVLTGCWVATLAYFMSFLLCLRVPPGVLVSGTEPHLKKASSWAKDEPSSHSTQVFADDAGARLVDRPSTC